MPVHPAFKRARHLLVHEQPVLFERGMQRNPANSSDFQLHSGAALDPALLANNSRGWKLGHQ